MRDVEVSSEGTASGPASILSGLARVLSDPKREPGETLDAILSLGCRQLGLELGTLARITGSSCEIHSMCAMSDTPLSVGQTLELSQTYCEKTLANGQTYAVNHAAQTPLADHPCYSAFAYESYIGTPVMVNGEVWGTLSFACREALARGFETQERESVELLAALLGNELERVAFKKQSAEIEHLKRAEDELRSMNVRFSAFMRNSPAIKWAVDSDGCYVFINPAFEEMMGVKAEHCVGRKPEDVLPAKAGRVLESISHPETAGIMPGEAQTIHVEVPILGRVLPLMVTRFLYTDVQGETYVGGSAVDLSDVTMVQRELAQRNKDLKALLYVISHDLREPLRAIRNFSGLVVEREYDGLQASSKDMLRRVVRGAERLDQLLSDVLTLSRAQRAEPATQAVACDSIVREVLSDLQPTIDQTKAAIEVEEGLPALTVDAFWLRQAVSNLLSNALKFKQADETPQVLIRAYEHKPAVKAESASDADERPMSGLIVEDRGPGVEEHQKERVFGLFQRGVSRDVPGTGAGLAIVAQVAERFGGRVWIEDREGGGARFVLAFYG
eukprot:g12442.t1